jgi:hypothetical protein
MRQKRASDVEKLANSPIGAEALTKPKMQAGYHHPKTSISGPIFPHGNSGTGGTPKSRESLKMTEGGVAL